MFRESFSVAKKKLLIEREIQLNNYTPIRPLNGTLGIKFLRQDIPIEVKNEIALWYVEELEKHAEFNFFYHTNKFNMGWTLICKVNQ